MLSHSGNLPPLLRAAGCALGVQQLIAAACRCVLLGVHGRAAGFGGRAKCGAAKSQVSGYKVFLEIAPDAMELKRMHMLFVTQKARASVLQWSWLQSVLHKKMQVPEHIEPHSFVADHGSPLYATHS